jgi:hypothetical protein
VLCGLRPTSTPYHSRLVPHNRQPHLQFLNVKLRDGFVREAVRSAA